MNSEKIRGCFTRDEDMYQVYVTLPEHMAEHFQVEREWEAAVPAEDGGENLRYAAVELIEEQAAGEMDGEAYACFCEYLEDDAKWGGELEEAEILEGEAAAEMVRAQLLARRYPGLEYLC